MKCRFCASTVELPFLDLGSAPPSNAYLDGDRLDQPEVWLPLRLLVCTRCWLGADRRLAGREHLFGDDYAYFSSVSSSWLEHSRRYVEKVVRRFALDADSHIVEVACNDGYLLQYVRAAGIPCLGIEPTASTAAAARAKGLEIVEEFFGAALGVRLACQGRAADLLVANNVLAHVPDISDFVAGFAAVLKPTGVATFEFPHLLEMVSGNQFDTAYHEHFSYLSLAAVEAVFSAHDLSVFDVEKLSTHGGSLRVYAQSRSAGVRPDSPAVAAIRAAEEAAGVRTPGFYAGFQQRAEATKHRFLTFLLEARAGGLRVAAYGAAAKGNTLLNFSGVRSDLVARVADRNPAKQGRCLPGSRIPIVSPEEMLAGRPDRIVILPWNLKQEIAGEMVAARSWGARFVVAVPALEQW